jgi:succinate dehydrogenase / fumarate reductase cytochrome b subunit
VRHGDLPCRSRGRWLYPDKVATSTVSAGRSTKTSSILLKSVMAVTGLIFVGYILAHMYGNLMIFGGEDTFNEYAEHLREIGSPTIPHSGVLWVLRVVLVASLVGHAYAAFALWSRAAGARQTRYTVRTAMRQVWVSRAMRWGGVALLLFVVFHILHLTTNTIQINGDFADPAGRLVSSFEVWWAVLLYTAAVLALGMHLLHGVWAAGMTLGLNTSAAAEHRLRMAATAVAAVTVVGFLAPPWAILVGLVP